MDSQNHSQEWYIGEPSKIARINSKLKNIEVPHAIQSPVPIQKRIPWEGIFFIFCKECSN